VREFGEQVAWIVELPEALHARTVALRLMVGPTLAISCEGRTDLARFTMSLADQSVPTRLEPPLVSCIALFGGPARSCPLTSTRPLRMDRPEPVGSARRRLVRRPTASRCECPSLALA
jgi:hypothetical protein